MPENIQTPPAGTEQQPAPAQQPPTEPGNPVQPDSQPATLPVNPVDYEQKFKASSRENQVLQALNKKQEEQLRTLTSPDAPTDAEMKALYPEWDSYDAFTRSVLVKQVLQDRMIAKTQSALLELTAEQKFQAELKQLYANPEFADLRNDPEFEKFVLKPKHKGLDIETLARAYLYPTRNQPQDPAPTDPSDPGLPKGSGGPRTPETPQLSQEEIEVIRLHDPKRYRKMLISGEIKL